MVLVEDSFADATLVKLALEETGLPLELQHLSDGQEMLDFLEDASPEQVSFILLDLNIPKAGGFDILGKKRQISRWKHIPVILYSSSTRKEDIMQCLNLDANAYVCKHVDYNDFNNSLTSLINFWGGVSLH